MERAFGLHPSGGTGQVVSLAGLTKCHPAVMHGETALVGSCDPFKMKVGQAGQNHWALKDQESAGYHYRVPIDATQGTVYVESG